MCKEGERIHSMTLQNRLQLSPHIMLSLSIKTCNKHAIVRCIFYKGDTFVLAKDYEIVICKSKTVEMSRIRDR